MGTRATAFGLATLLLIVVGGSRAGGRASSPTLALPPFPGIEEAIVQFDRLDASEVTKMQSG